jgi:hypothetical protein
MTDPSAALNLIPPVMRQIGCDRTGSPVFLFRGEADHAQLRIRLKVNNPVYHNKII